MRIFKDTTSKNNGQPEPQLGRRKTNAGPIQQMTSEEAVKSKVHRAIRSVFTLWLASFATTTLIGIKNFSSI